jgi:hypothetical protein
MVGVEGVTGVCGRVERVCGYGTREFAGGLEDADCYFSSANMSPISY